MAFTQAQLLKVENGYIVGISKMDLDERGQWKPSQEQFIAENLEKAIDLVKAA